MGGPMVDRLLGAGFDVCLHARKEQVAEAYRARGARVVGTVAEVARDASTIVICPFDEEQAGGILFGSDGLVAAAGPNTVIVQHATVSPSASAWFARDAAASGVTVLDAPISGRAEDIGAGNLTVLVGGPPAALDDVRDVLASYSSSVIATGDAGSATLLKLVNNFVFAAHVQVAGAALTMLADMGVDVAAGNQALNKCSARSYAFEVLESLGSDREKFASAAAPYLRKDVGLADVALAQAGADSSFLSEVVRRGTFQLVPESKELSS